MDVEQYAVESEKIQIMRQQVEATELLAYEQRTANLIAHCAQAPNDKRIREIEERLGLR